MSDIDLVITWVDGTDAAWKKQYMYWLHHYDLELWPNSFEERFVPHTDLQILLRSVARYAPDNFRRIWIVHDDIQIPPVNTDLVTLVPHSQIIPAEFLPTFNSNVIESYLHIIPGLSQRFVYANDDAYFTGSVTNEVFFYGMKPFIFLHTPVFDRHATELENNQHQKNLMLTNLLLNKKLYPDLDPNSFKRQIAAHLTSGLTKDICRKGWSLFEVDLTRQSQFKFRRMAHVTNGTVNVVAMLYPWLGIELGLALPGSSKYAPPLLCSGDAADDVNRLNGLAKFTEPCIYES